MDKYEIEQIFEDCNSKDYARRNSARRHTDWMNVAYTLKADRDALVRFVRLIFTDNMELLFSGDVEKWAEIKDTFQAIPEATRKEIEDG